MTGAGSKPLPYGRQLIGEDDIEAVVAVLRSDWLTTGPAVERFEAALSEYTGASHAVAVSSGTAALHAAMHTLDLRPHDEVIVPPLTFAATANAVVYCGGTPVFADVREDSLTIDAACAASKINSRTRAVVAVDYAGQPCDYRELRELADRHNLTLLADACHSLGATYSGGRVGTLADITAFSFHPVKHITTGEGGMAVTNDPLLARRMRTFRNHGITTDHKQRAEQGAYFYEMVELGFNYRISDIQCALGASQLKKLPGWLEQRALLATEYDRLLASTPAIATVTRLPDRTHAYHLYPVRLGPHAAHSRDHVFAAMRAAGIGCNVHYVPVHLHPFYRNRFGTEPGLCPIAEAAYGQLLSLPMHMQMNRQDVARVTETLVDRAGSLL